MVIRKVPADRWPRGGGCRSVGLGRGDRYVLPQFDLETMPGATPATNLPDTFPGSALARSSATAR